MIAVAAALEAIKIPAAMAPPLAAAAQGEGRLGKREDA